MHRACQMILGPRIGGGGWGLTKLCNAPTIYRAPVFVPILCCVSLMSGGVWYGRGHLAPSQCGVCPGVVRRVPDPEGRAGQGAQEPGGATAGTLASTLPCVHFFLRAVERSYKKDVACLQHMPGRVARGCCLRRVAWCLLFCCLFGIESLAPHHMCKHAIDYWWRMTSGKWPGVPTSHTYSCCAPAANASRLRYGAVGCVCVRARCWAPSICWDWDAWYRGERETAAVCGCDSCMVG